jgi:hypothetical protein
MIERKNVFTGEIYQFESDAQLLEARNTALRQWQAAAAALEDAKNVERTLRDVSVTLASNPDQVKGTENVDLGDGWTLKTVKKINYGFVKDATGQKVDRNAINRALETIEGFGEAGVLIAERLVKWTPELSVTEYNNLPDERMKRAIDSVIVTTHGAPTLEIKPPKAPK